jgi:hypothetical protein
MLVVAVFSRHGDAIECARCRLVEVFGPVTMASTPYAFTQTDYYAPTMGIDLRKQFLAFHDLVAPDRLAAIKRTTNALEQQLAASNRWPDVRPVNLDPGILTLGKFQLATTKDQAHRIYLGEGIYAEVTLRFQAGAFVPWPWTYADYRQPEVLAFLKEVRDDYYRRLNSGNEPVPSA